LGLKPGACLLYLCAQSDWVDRVAQGDAHDLESCLFIGAYHSGIVAVDLDDARERLKWSRRVWGKDG
jgi:hypothetical protein